MTHDDRTAALVRTLDVIRVHLALHDVAVPAIVSVRPGGGDTDVTVQLDTITLPDTATALLSWVDTLADVHGEMWRVSGGYAVHLSVQGRTTSGIRIRAYAAVDHEPVVFGHLEPGQALDLAPAQLATWAAGTTSGGVAA